MTTLRAKRTTGDTYITSKQDTYNLTSGQIIQNEGISLPAAAFLNLKGSLIFGTHNGSNTIDINVDGGITQDVTIGGTTLHFTNGLLTSVT